MNAATFDLTVTLSAAQTSAVTVPFTVGGSAGNPADFTIGASPLVFAPSQTSRTITVTVVDDTAVDPGETNNGGGHGPRHHGHGHGHGDASQ